MQLKNRIFVLANKLDFQYVDRVFVGFLVRLLFERLRKVICLLTPFP